MAKETTHAFRRHHVIEAARRWREQPGYGGFRESRQYDVIIRGKPYPPKAIVAIAGELAGGRLLLPSEFPGAWDGKWHRALKSLRFDIVAKGDAAGGGIGEAVGDGEPAGQGAAVDPDAPAAVPVSAAQLAEALQTLPAPLVITKNKHRHSAANFRIDPTDKRRWLDGDWTGTPARVRPGQAFVAHYVEREATLWLGRYRGTTPATPGRHCLMLDTVCRYVITDPQGDSPAHAVLASILKQEGSVTYSYFFPVGASGQEVPEARFAQVQIRLQQPMFRKAVLEACGGRCVITGCTIAELLDAAHLPGRDWRAGHNTAADGIALRVDLHRALDAELIRLDPQHRLAWVHETLEDQYGQYRVAPHAV